MILRKFTRSGKIKLGVCTLITCAIIFNWHRAFTNASGPSGGYSSAPSESNCTSCHFGGGLTTSSSVISLKVNGSTTLKYKTDSTYTITVTATKSGISKWGFQTTVLKDSNNTFIGTLSSGSSDVQVVSTSIGGKTRYYAEHTSSGNTGSGTRSWSFSWKAPHTNVGTVTFYISVNAADGNGVESGDAIHTNKFTLSYIPSTVPAAGFTYSPSLPCAGDTVTFHDTSTRNPTSWAWTFPGGTPSTSTSQNPKVVFSWGGHKVSLTATNKDGSSAPVSKAINVVQMPSDTIYRSGPTTFCDGDSLLLTADFVGSDFKWSTGSTNQAIHVYKSGTYFCMVSNGNCTVKSQEVKITVLPKPTISIVRSPNQDTLCAGDTMTFYITSSAPNITVYNNSKILYKGLNKPVKVGNFSGANNSVFAVAQDSIGCSSDVTKAFKVISRARLTAPALSAGTSTTQSVTVNWSAVSGAIGYEVSADTGKTWKTPSGTLTHTEGGLASNEHIQLKVRALDHSACGTGNINAIGLVSLPCSQTTYNLQADTLICPGAKTTIRFGKISAQHYSIILNGVSARDTLYSFSPGQDTTLNFSMYDSLKSSCGSFPIDIHVSIVKLPSMVNIMADRSFYCGSKAATTIVCQTPFEEYDYYFNGKLIQNDTSKVYTNNYFADGDKVYMMGRNKGCASAPSNDILLHRYMPPVPLFSYNIGLNREVSFMDKTLTKDSRIWFFGDGATDTSANPVHTYATNKTYSVTMVATGPEGCGDSLSKSFLVSGVEPIVNPATLSIRPNPFNNLIIISFYGNNYGILNVNVTDVQGRVVKTIAAGHMVKGLNEFNVPVEDLRSGVYILRIDDGNQVINRQIIKN